MMPFPSKSDTPTLSVNIRSLTRPGGGSPLLTSINFELISSECIAIVGPNGSGKTSLLRVISQTLKADGEICFAGQPMSSLNAIQRARRIAVMVQNDFPDLRLTLEDYIALGRIPYAMDMNQGDHSSIIRKAIQESGLKHLSKRKLGSLSGGELQRATLARALVQTPRLLLLDEPTNHLDHPSREEMLSLVKNKGIAVIAVLHDLNCVDDFADRVLILHHGNQVIFDTPERALTTEFLCPVFGLNTFSVTHPKDSCKQVRIFEVSNKRLFSTCKG